MNCKDKKIRYTVKYLNSNNINHKYYYLSQIERGGLKELFDTSTCTILDSSMYTGLKTLDKVEIYENDFLKNARDEVGCVSLIDGEFSLVYFDDPARESLCKLESEYDSSEHCHYLKVEIVGRSDLLF